MNIEVEKNRIFFNDGNIRQEIHPFWLRERVENKEFLDEITQQRLFVACIFHNYIFFV